MNPLRVLRSQRALYVVRSIAAWAFVVVAAFPLFWMVSSSLKSDAEIQQVPPTLLPQSPTFEQYGVVLGGDFQSWFLNSAIIATGTTVLVVVTGVLGGYSLARFKYRGRSAFSVSVMLTYLFPKILLLVPLVIIFRSIHLTDTYVALIVANTTFALPFTLWLLRAFFLGLPIELEQAALIDGASRLRALVDVVIPQALPGILSIAIFSFILSWNEYLFAVTFSRQGNTTLPVGLAGYSSQLNIEWGPLMAASVAVTLPMVILFAIIQSRYVGGLGEGAIRG